MDWRSALATYAPWGHAWLFARTGDFARAQALLAAALRQGFAERRRRYFLSASVRTSLKTVERFVREASESAERAEPAPAPTRFSEFPRVRDLERAVEALRAFPERERRALVLLYVDEVPPERVREWIGADEAFLGDLRSRFEAALEPEAVDRLRQFRLSDAFMASLFASIDERSAGAFTFLRLFVWVVSVSVGAALVFRPGERTSLAPLLCGTGIGGLVLALTGVGGLLAIRWAYDRLAPAPIWRADSRPGLAREILTFAALPVLVAHGFSCAVPEMFLAAGAAPLSLGAVRHWPAALGLWVAETAAIYTLMTYYLPSLGRGALAAMAPASAGRS